MTPTVVTSPPLTEQEYLGMRSKLLRLLYRQHLEREQLRCTIHDDIGQFLTSISINAGLLAKKGHPHAEKGLITAITSASKMACRSTHELTKQLGPGSSLAQNGIEPELTALARHYDIDEAGPKLRFEGVRFLDRAPTPLITQVCNVFEQYLLLFIHCHQASKFELVLTQPKPGRAYIELQVVATGKRLCSESPGLSNLEQELRLSSHCADLHLSSGSQDPRQQLILNARLATDRSGAKGNSSSC